MAPSERWLFPGRRLNRPITTRQFNRLFHEAAAAENARRSSRRLRRAAPVSRPTLEVADIFRDSGAAWRAANASHVSLGQMKVMSAIERCRTAALGGHVAACTDYAVKAKRGAAGVDGQTIAYFEDDL